MPPDVKAADNSSFLIFAGQRIKPAPDIQPCELSTHKWQADPRSHTELESHVRSGRTNCMAWEHICQAGVCRLQARHVLGDE